MNELILHPSKNFLDARNPSSLFQYKQQMAYVIWRKIHEEAKWHKTDSWGYIIINGEKYFGFSPQGLFENIKHLFQ